MEVQTDSHPVSLRDCEKLKLLNCRWEMLRSAEEDELDDAIDQKEPLEKIGSPTPDFDVASILPKSLELMYVHGVIDNANWAKLTALLENNPPPLPNLTRVYFTQLKSRHRYARREVFSNTQRPPLHDERPLYRLFERQQDGWLF